jgi:hypothetical protein
MPSTGQKANAAGVYQCRSYGKNKTVPKGHKLPPCRCGGTEWEAAMTTTKKPKKRKKGFLESLFS